MLPAAPRVSVLLPVRDALPHLPEALGSVLAEPLALEVIAVDDGSTDGSGGWLDEAARREPRLRLFHVPAGGIAAALNLALGAARAPFVARMDADDRSLPGRLGALVALLESRPELSAAGTGVRLHPEGLQGSGMRRYVAWLDAIDEGSLPREIWIECPLAHPTLGARRERLLAAGGYREGPFPEDYELLLRLHARGEKLGKVATTLYEWRDHGARLTRTDPRYAPGAHRALKVSALRAGPLRGRSRVAVWGAAKTGRPFARALRAGDFEVVAWVDVDPRQVGRRLHAAPVLAPAGIERLRGTPILVAVGAAGARPLIRAELDRRGFAELADYWVVA